MADRVRVEKDDTGWSPLTRERTGASVFVVSPFNRLARTHAAAVAGDTLIALALAGSLFFSISPTQAKGRVALGLLLTMAPFALVAPLIGPWLDRVRGGRRWVVVGANGARAVVCMLMIGNLHSLLLFPMVFTILVLSKAYQVAKSALVPTLVAGDDELVTANSRLSLLSGLVGFAAAIPGLLVNLLFGGEGVVVLAMVVFTVAAAAGTQIPPTRVAADRADTAERQELRGAGIRLAASAMGLLRGMVGFITFLIAFDLRRDGAPTWQFGVIIAASGIGSLLGAAAAPSLRRAQIPEERIIQVFLLATAAMGILGAYIGQFAGALAVALAVGVAASGSKLAFDSILQRDAPDANRGRSFARFETRFQLVWVLGALIPVIVPEQAEIPARVGFLLVAAAAAFALVSYLAGAKAVAAGKPIPSRDLDGKARRAVGRLWTRVRDKELDGRRPPAGPAPKPTIPQDAPTKPQLPAQPQPQPLGPESDLPAIPEWRREPTLVDEPTVTEPPPSGSDDATVVVDPTNL
jgi:hypothetical protein